MGNFSEAEFLLAVSDTFAAYQTFGARSAKKLVPAHTFLTQGIAFHLRKIGLGHLHVRSVSAGGEATVPGRYYDKRVDVTIARGDAPLVAVGFKFVTSNFKQNANNYFENMLGETANLRRNSLGVGYLVVLRARTPYYTKGGAEQKIEMIGERDLEKYRKLLDDSDFPHRPDVLGISLLDVDDANQAVTPHRLGPSGDRLLGKVGIEDFLRKCAHLAGTR